MTTGFAQLTSRNIGNKENVAEFKRITDKFRTLNPTLGQADRQWAEKYIIILEEAKNGGRQKLGEQPVDVSGLLAEVREAVTAFQAKYPVTSNVAKLAGR